jgi:Gpi18-like mannosyltransferase
MRKVRKIDARSTLVGILTQPAGVAIRKGGLAFLWVVVGVAITVVLRLKLLDYRSGDVNAFVNWCDDIEKKGFAKALIGGDCNYNAAYVYLLWLATKLPFDRALVIKTFSILCDYVCATALAWVVFRAMRSRLRALLAALTLLITPTVVFNGALWGQCDMVYAAPLAVALAAFLRRRYYLATALFGLAISIKLQAVFLFPLLGIWVLRRELPLRALVLIPVTYLVTLIPAWLAGCSWADLLTIYVKQAQQYSGLTLNAPTIFFLLADEEKWIGPFGLWFAVAAVFMVFLACVYAKVRTTATVLVQEAIVFASLAPFLLPHMHERYLFLADVLSVVYAFVFPTRFWIAIGVVGASFAGYSSFLFSKTPVSLTVAATMMGVSSVVVAADLLRHHYPRAFAAGRDENEETGAFDDDRRPTLTGGPKSTSKHVASA